MKVTNIFILAVCSVLVASCQPKCGAVKNVDINTVEDSVSYAIGMQQGQQLLVGMKQLDIDTVLNKDILIKGFIDALNESALQIEEMRARTVVQNYIQAKMAEQQQKQEAKALEDNADVKKAGEEFLAQNAKKSGITVTSSGLQYEVIKKGTGAKPTLTSVVKVLYHGTLIDGTVFDSAVERGEPAEFGVNQVIPGWTEALQLMSTGSKWKLYIPQELAYGARQMGDKIKPYSTLIFEVELLEIVKQ